MTLWRRYTVAWLGRVVIGMANGTARELTYRKSVGELAAHQISTATAISLFAAYFQGLERRWPIPSRRSALGIGATWLLLTVAFEFGFGHCVAKKSWAELLRDYDLSEGRVWGSFSPGSRLVPWPFASSDRPGRPTRSFPRPQG